MARDPELFAHQEWLGYLQPVGLVVSPPALAAAGAYPNKNIIPDHARFLDCVENVTLEGESDPRPAIRQFPRLATHVLGWEPADLVGTSEGGRLPDSLEVTLTEYNETLRPTYAVREFSNAPGTEAKWLLLMEKVKTGISLDDTAETPDHRWQASPQARFERLLRGTQVPIGLLSNGISLRLVYAPHGETSGYLTFPVQAMTEVAGRPIFAALQMLLSAERLFTLPDKQRLPAILSDSRKYQNLVSTKLAEQVLAALYELVRGFQAADDQRHGDLLRDVFKDDPNQVYGGLLRVLLRLVFILYAEDRSLLSNDEVYQKYYSVLGLFERLREDAGRHTDTMDHRYGAWAQLLTLFRLIYDGGRHGGLKLLPRKGYLFDSDLYPFLEGRSLGSKRQPGERTEPPRVSDGVVFRVLQNLLILDGERLSYRTLDVEQIGSVYETMMGFNLEVAQGRSIAINPKKTYGAPTTINLEELLAVKPADRGKWLDAKTDQKIAGQAASALKDAKTPEDALAALEKKVARAATPNIVPPGAMILQPSDERRKSGSHYTPRTLTEPIVVTTFRPILERLSLNPTPEQILDLKICDPAMGSGAFLVAVCRFLAELLVKAWHGHNCVPSIPPDEDEVLHARRIVAQRCLYGVDRNPMAVDLAKMSLWLATLAKDHPFTFLDHALRHGDSLVGLSKAQILGFHWKPEKQRDFTRAAIEGQMTRAMEQRRQIREAPDQTSEALLRERLLAADGFLDQARRYGDLAISAFFAADNDRKRKESLQSLADDLAAQRSEFRADRHERLEAARALLRSGEHPVVPFHWEIEFPEVFERANPGFDAFVGNPPFMGGRKITERIGEDYSSWLKCLHADTSGGADMVAHFFRRAFDMLARDGTMGFIATNSIYQGDTRASGLSWICTNGGAIYSATKRIAWPGVAAVIISIIHVHKSRLRRTCYLNGHPVERISAFLLRMGPDTDPSTLQGSKELAFQGDNILGLGFTFDDSEPEASSIAEMKRLVAKDPRNQDRIFLYVDGATLNYGVDRGHQRFVINFEEMTESQARRWPDLMEIVERKVRPGRESKDAKKYPRMVHEWWKFWNYREDLYRRLADEECALAIARFSDTYAFAFLPANVVFHEKLVVFPLQSYAAFCCLQCRIHEAWVRAFGSSLKDDLQYTPTNCTANFPFLTQWESSANLEEPGKNYYEFRTEVSTRNNEGLTETYNRFHDPDERSPDILKLRELHAAMDRAVLKAYDWKDLAEKATCEFLLDYEEEEDEDETGGGRRRKKPWRYRWPDEFRDEVLARLLELNRQRAEQERLSGAAAEGKAKKPRKTSKRVPDANSPDLFDKEVD
jgi:N-6 DNA Methylase